MKTIKLPEPSFRLTCRNGQYFVNKPGIDSVDCYTTETVHRLIAEAVEAEREACAALCKTQTTPATGSVVILNATACAIAHAIRARSEGGAA